MTTRPTSSEAQENELTKEAFLAMAGRLGFDVDDPHMEELLAEVRNRLRGIEPLFDVDVSGVEPVTRFSAGFMNDGEWWRRHNNGYITTEAQDRAYREEGKV